jgi:hypothetical protein
MEPGLEATSYYDPPNLTFPFGSYICVVDIDRGTGEVKVRRFVAVDDCGVRINPMIVEGQIHGGLTEGFAIAFMQEIQFDEENLPSHAPGPTEYYQINSEWDSTWRSRSMGGHRLPFDPRAFVKLEFYQYKFDELELALIDPDEEDPAAPPVHVRRVSFKALAGAEQFYVIPYGWTDAPWWSDDQVDNLHAIVDAVKQRYNVDENRVVVSGVSDGGSGAYYVAMRDTTPYASFLPLNGYWMVLASADVDHGEIFANNLRNKPLFIVNGGRDPLYPSRIVDPYVEHYRKGGVALEYHPQPEAGHNTQWWPVMKEPFEAFVRSHPRQPLPDALTWETADGSAHNRAHWLVIDRLGSVKDEAKALADLNEMAAEPALDFGVRSIGTRVNRVLPGSNAEQLGLKSGDVLVRLNDQTVRGGTDVQEALDEVKPGAHIDLLVARDNLPVEIGGTYEPKLATGPPRKLFARSGRSGRVDLTRTGNLVQAATHGVRSGIFAREIRRALVVQRDRADALHGHARASRSYPQGGGRGRSRRPRGAGRRAAAVD